MVRVTKDGGLIRICEGNWMQADPNKGLPRTLEDVKGIQEIAFNQTQRNIGGLRNLSSQEVEFLPAARLLCREVHFLHTMAEGIE